ncbi:MAG TPA: rhodanese-like domain-containing protein [Bacteriovoracaceae bacterium]|nr:rhodanese-like domain-containing protein [Bacteriovoracaceae bacterium]
MSNKLMTLIDLHQSLGKLGSKDVILDVRRPEEFQQGHIENALNIPVDQVASHAEDLKKYENIYIHCKLGGRAKMAYEALQAAGLTNLICISDAGMDAWVTHGFPVMKG